MVHVRRCLFGHIFYKVSIFVNSISFLSLVSLDSLSDFDLGAEINHALYSMQIFNTPLEVLLLHQSVTWLATLIYIHRGFLQRSIPIVFSKVVELGTKSILRIMT